MTEAVSESVQVNKSTVRAMKGDIADLEVEAFVFYASPDLAIGSGFGTAISARGGPSIEKELKELSPVSLGEAVVTAAGKMKAKHIIHAVGPRFQEEEIEGKLRTTVLNALKRADEKGIVQVAFPAMGAGFYGIPIADCARVMVDTIQGYLKGETKIREVIFCLVDSREFAPFQKQLATLS
ncbi:MAG: macro domain-containing protein [Planctomycetota bacterium]|jgi:O-acetyl-ADP-ribose deacetylase (regulator of RNase III)